MKILYEKLQNQKLQLKKEKVRIFKVGVFFQDKNYKQNVQLHPVSCRTYIIKL